MKIFTTIISIKNYLIEQNKSIALVPTMGGLHCGHLSIIKAAKKHADLVVVSIFINNKQFEKQQDFINYPRYIEDDTIKLINISTDVLFIPDATEIYNTNDDFNYQIGRLNTILCALTRPVFFNGVVWVVRRLFDIIKPNIAIFGEKDYQQLLIIQQMTNNLNLAVKILSMSIYREENGLAMSTRNNYLTSMQKNTAKNLYLILTNAANNIKNRVNANEVIRSARLKLKVFFELDYCEVLDSKDLSIINKNTKEIIIIAAVKLDKIILTDNIRIHYVYN